MEIKILPDAAAVAEAVAEEFARSAGKSVALAGGTTPRNLYGLLAGRSGIAWNKIHFFWSDERHVPPDHDDSNYGMAHEALLSKVPVPEENIHRIKTENPSAQKAAEEYSGVLESFFHLKPGEFPRLDLILLGMGPDGHTASLFPGTDVLEEKTALVAAPWVEKLKTYRVTMTPPVINNAACVIFMVTGEEKAETLRAVLKGEDQTRFPSQLIRPKNGRLLWLVDHGAARLLGPNP
jgi:6-phosphogluconolactonase